MRYHEPPPASREILAAVLDDNDGPAIADALVGVTKYDPDWRWVQDTCLRLVSHPNMDVRAIAITCLGHLARIHGELDTDKVRPVLTELITNPELGGRAEDALDDVRLYARTT